MSITYQLTGIDIAELIKKDLEETERAAEASFQKNGGFSLVDCLKSMCAPVDPRVSLMYRISNVFTRAEKDGQDGNAAVNAWLKENNIIIV